MDDPKITSNPDLPTVVEFQAKKLGDLLRKGVPREEAEQQAGITLRELRKDNNLSYHARKLLARCENAGLAREEDQKKLARAVLTEVMMQDEDVKSKVNAAKTLLGQPMVAVQINNVSDAYRDPEILESLKSLGLPLPEEENDD